MNSEISINGASPEMHTQVVGTTTFETVAAPTVMDQSIQDSSLNSDFVEQGEQMQDFLSRPALISSGAWDSSMTSGRIYPWSLWANRTAVTRKLQNYSFFSANLHVRIEVNGTPFHYGLLNAAYMPNAFPAWKYNEALADDKLFTPQLIHVEMEPGSNGVYEMVLPFVWHTRKLNMYRDSFKYLGVLTFHPIVPLYVSNNAQATPISYRIYAWCTEVSLEGPTVANVIKTQSAKVSRPSKPSSKARGLLDTAYDIGSTVIGWAEWLGFSRPLVNFGAPTSSIIQKFDNITVEGNDNIRTVALNNEVSRPLYFPTVGENTPDPLLISELTQREGFYTKFPIEWQTGTVPDSVLLTVPVTPAIFYAENTPALSKVYYPPVAYYSRNFANWRGTMIYRVQVIASAQHSGKLRIYYDPIGGPESFAATVDDPNIATRIHVMDLAKERSIDFEVGWCSDRPFLPLGQFTNTDNVTNKYHTNCNGFFVIESSSWLASPLASQSVFINVYVRAGADFELMGQLALEDRVKTVLSTPVLHTPALLDNEDPEPQVTIIQDVDHQQAGIYTRQYQPATKVSLAKTQETGPYSMELSGERVVSLRPYLKRYHPETHYGLSGTGNTNPERVDFYTYVAPKHPFTTAPSAYVTDVYPPSALPMAHLSTSFVGRRGGVKCKVHIPTAMADGQWLDKMIVSMRSRLNYDYSQVATAQKTRTFDVTNDDEFYTTSIKWWNNYNHGNGTNLVYAHDYEPVGTLFPDYGTTLFEPSALFTPINETRTKSSIRIITLKVNGRHFGVEDFPLVMTAAADDYDLCAYVCCPLELSPDAVTYPTWVRYL